MHEEIRQAVDSITAMSDDPVVKSQLRQLAHAVALILVVEQNPDTNPETVTLCDASRHQLRNALNMEPFVKVVRVEVEEVETCDECGSEISETAESMFDPSHGEACSLHPQNTVGGD